MGKSIERHSITKSIFLHLIPGVLVGLVYFLFAPVVKLYGFPTVMALIISGILVLLPFELGFILYQKKRKGEKLFGETIKYLKPLKFWQFILWVAAIFFAAGLLFKAFGFTTEFIMKFFHWIPSNYMLSMGLSGEFTKLNLIITYMCFLVFIVLILPAVEEIYFRGYLLPRMPEKLKGCVIPIHSTLFALYHTWTPWLIVTRTVGVLPLIYLVKRKENIYLGIAAHCIINSIDFIVGLLFILKM